MKKRIIGEATARASPRAFGESIGDSTGARRESDDARVRHRGVRHPRASAGRPAKYARMPSRIDSASRR
jgi:hypothetical protein